MIKIIGSFAVGFIVGLIIILGWNAYTDARLAQVVGQTTIPDSIPLDTNTPNNDPITTEEITVATPSIDITVNDQAAGSAVLVTSVTLSTDGWIVVHEERNGLIGNALGAKRRNAGTYQNTIIPLLRDTQENTRYWIVLYNDDGDRQFNLSTDFPLKNTENEPIISSFWTQ
ncbi:hypothetical protein CL644_00480 [bacterium]|nr:hypothetical protein [bacterium]|tara:strand:+ start:325 stop:837 length:513 start_codon:yes stop_codon:yes gene_type:complete